MENSSPRWCPISKRGQKYSVEKISGIIPDESNERTNVSWKCCALIASAFVMKNTGGRKHV
jgi:hypothetical protein